MDTKDVPHGAVASVVYSSKIAPRQHPEKRSESSAVFSVDLMHCRPHGHLDGFEVQLTGLAAALKDDAEQFAYFAFDFLMDRFRRFFSWAVRMSSTGRRRQIFSLTSTKARLSS